MESFEDREKKTIYNYYHDYFTAKHDVLYYPEITDYIKINRLGNVRLTWDKDEANTEEPAPWLLYDVVDEYAQTNGSYAIRHDFKSIRNELKYVTEAEN